MARRFVLGLLLVGLVSPSAYAVDCDYLHFLYEGIRKQCEAGVTSAHAKYQPCETMVQMTEKYVACTKKDTRCVKISDKIRHLDGCYVRLVKNLCDKPLRLYFEGVSSDPGRQRFDNYVMRNEVDLVRCCGGSTCDKFGIFHAEPVR